MPHPPSSPTTGHQPPPTSTSTSTSTPATAATSPGRGRRGRRPRLDEQDLAFLRELKTTPPFLSDDGILAELEKKRGKRIGIATLYRALRRLGLTKSRPQAAPTQSTDAPALPKTNNPPSLPRYRPEHRAGPPRPGAYASDLNDAEWEQVRPLVEEINQRGRPPTQDRRRILDALFYIGRTGCQWRMLPHDYPPWQTVASCFYRWTRRGVLQAVYTKLRRIYRETLGRQPEPSAGIIDSQTAKTTEKGARRV